MISSRQFELFFDGGYNGEVYGSWEITFNGFKKRVSRKVFITADSKDYERKTCNSAEYLALIDALGWLSTVKHKREYDLKVFADSRLVVNQVLGKYRCKKEHLMIFCNVVRTSLEKFRVWNIHWRSRTYNVKRFGH
jgi:ribonuclease HI